MDGMGTTETILTEYGVGPALLRCASRRALRPPPRPPAALLSGRPRAVHRIIVNRDNGHLAKVKAFFEGKYGKPLIDWIRDECSVRHKGLPQPPL